MNALSKKEVYYTEALSQIWVYRGRSVAVYSVVEGTWSKKPVVMGKVKNEFFKTPFGTFGLTSKTELTHVESGRLIPFKPADMRAFSKIKSRQNAVTSFELFKQACLSQGTFDAEEKTQFLAVVEAQSGQLDVGSNTIQLMDAMRQCLETLSTQGWGFSQKGYVYENGREQNGFRKPVTLPNGLVLYMPFEGGSYA